MPGLPKHMLLAITFILTLTSFTVSADAVWIDVRSKLEHLFDNIDGDPRIPHSEIVNEVNKFFPNKSQEIMLYCAKGVRAEKAKSLLIDAGYTNVSNVGGIDDARAKRDMLP